MKIFLMITGEFLLALIIVIAGIYFWLKSKLRGFGKTIGEALEGICKLPSMVPPETIELIPFNQLDDDAVWDDNDRIAELTMELEKSGFKMLDDYRIFIETEINIRGFIDEDKSVYAAVYENEKFGCWTDFISFYQDDGSITCSNYMPSGLNRPEEHVLKNFEGLNIPELYKKFIAERGHRNLQLLDSNKFKASFEQCYAEVMDWRIERGGPTETQSVLSKILPSRLEFPHKETWMSDGTPSLTSRLSCENSP